MSGKGEKERDGDKRGEGNVRGRYRNYFVTRRVEEGKARRKERREEK